jgi:putative phosphoesterase
MPLARSLTSPSARLIGLISDTHGLVRPTVFQALAGVELILHAGDVGDGVLEELAVIAPVLAVQGNTDPPRRELPKSRAQSIEGVRIHMSHGHELGSPTPEKLLAAYDADVIVYGHTHRQLVQQAGARWVVNPGAAGARRFELRASVAKMRIDRGAVAVELVDLE